MSSLDLLVLAYREELLPHIDPNNSMCQHLNTLSFTSENQSKINFYHHAINFEMNLVLHFYEHLLGGVSKLLG